MNFLQKLFGWTESQENRTAEAERHVRVTGAPAGETAARTHASAAPPVSAASPAPVSPPAAAAPSRASRKSEIRQAVASLLLELRTSAPEARDELRRKLAGLGELAVPPLIDALNHQEKPVRLDAIAILELMFDNRALAPLAVLEKDADPEIAAAAKSAGKALRRAREMARAAKTLRQRQEARQKEIDAMVADIKKTDHWRLLFEHLSDVSQPAGPPSGADGDRAERWAAARVARVEELRRRGLPALPDHCQDGAQIAAAWKNLFARAASYSPTELSQSAKGLVAHLPAEEAGRLLLARFTEVESHEDAAQVLAHHLAVIGLPKFRAVLREWIEGPRRRQNVSPAVASFVYGDVGSWVETMVGEKDFAALAAIFNSRDYSPAFQLGTRQKGAREAPLKAGREAIPAIMAALNPDEVGFEELAKLLVELDAREAVPELKRHFDAGRGLLSVSQRRSIIRFVYGIDVDSLSGELLPIVRGPGDDTSKHERIEGILRLAGWLGPDATVLYCGCGYPIRIRYGDGSIGPVNPALTAASPELYVTEYSCPNCRRHVDTITT